MVRTPGLVTLLALGACGRVGFTGIDGATNAGGCVAKLASYGDQICVLRRDGVVWCWGSNTYGQLGDGTFTDHGLPQPTLVTDATDLASGEDTVCAIREGGAVSCWGLNDKGQVGDGTMTARPTPTPVTLAAAAVEIHVSQTHTCARLANGTGACWGSNVYGELGSAMPAGNQLVPQAAPVGGNAAFTLGDNVTCVLRPDSTVACFGIDGEGELADGTTTSRPTPLKILNVTDPVVSVAGGCHRHLCAATATGQVWCWGENMSGEVGTGMTSAFENAPMHVPGITNAVQVTVGAFHSCARTSTGEIWCWGKNDAGQLGDRSVDDRYLPVQAAYAGDPVDVQAFCGGTFVLDRDGTVSAWGAAAELGTGDAVNQIAAVDVPIPCP